MKKQTAVIKRILNEALKADPKAITELMETRVSCSPELGDHPTIIVQGRLGSDYEEVGVLGLINGICGALTGEYLVAVYNRVGEVVKFVKHDGSLRSKPGQRLG